MLFAGGLLLLLFLCGSIAIAIHTNLVSPLVMNFTYDTYTLYGETAVVPGWGNAPSLRVYRISLIIATPNAQPVYMAGFRQKIDTLLDIPLGH